jgi:hypothetical protein
VSLCESTLAFGKAEEPPPDRCRRFNLARWSSEVAEGEAWAGLRDPITCLIDVPPA